MQITFVRSNTNAVGEYRIKHPMLALNALGHQCHMLTLNQQGVKVANIELDGDILVLQRQTSTDVIELRNTLPKRPVTVYEVDDNPWEWHPWDSIHLELGHHYGECVRKVMGECDAVTCTTPILAERVRREFPTMPIWVVPNAIDYQVRDWSATQDRKEFDLDDKVVLGWTGSVHHTRDGEALLTALPTVFDMHPNAVFLMQCDRSVYYEWTNRFVSNPEFRSRLRWVPPLAFDLHPTVYSVFDINLAPLENTPFNTCKSDLRLIEGGAHGVPYVASSIAPYLEFHRQSDGIGGYLAATPAEWIEAIDTLIDEREARGQSLSRYVQARRSLAVVAGQWQATFEGILTHQQGTTVSPWGPLGRNSQCPCGSAKKYKRCCIPAYG